MNCPGNVAKIFDLIGFVLLSLLLLLQTIEAQTCVEPPTGIMSWWSGDGHTRDIVGGKKGQLHNGARFASGIVGRAFRFDGIDDYVSVPYDPIFDFGTGPFTIEFWFNSAATGRFGFFDRRVNGGSYPGYWLLNVPAGILDFGADNCSTAGCGLDKRVQMNPAPFLDAQWHHLAAVRDGTTLALYIDGILGASQTFSDSENVNGSAEIIMGSTFEPIGDFLPGQMDEVSIYNRALSADEIQTIFAAGSAGKCKPLGGRVFGVRPGRVICTNVTTGQRVTIFQHGTRSWNCKKAGLVVHPGNIIRQSVTSQAE